MDIKIIKDMEILIRKSTQKFTIYKHLFTFWDRCAGEWNLLEIKKPSKIIGHFSNLCKILLLM
jgi:hypothetical protein